MINKGNYLTPPFCVTYWSTQQNRQKDTFLLQPCCSSLYGPIVVKLSALAVSLYPYHQLLFWVGWCCYIYFTDSTWTHDGVKLTRSFFLPKRTQTPAVYREEKEATSAPPAQTVPLDKEALKVIWTTGKEWTRALSISELTHLPKGGHQGLILAPTSVCIDPEMTNIQLTGHQGTIAILLLWPNSCRAQHQAQAEPRSWNTIYLGEVLSCFRLLKWRHKWTNG